MKKYFVPTSLISLALLFGSFSCSKSGTVAVVAGSDLPPEILPEEKNHTWYGFTNQSFEVIDLPKNASKIQDKPWTEAIRISSAGSGDKAFALVNRLGILALSENSVKLYGDLSIFSSQTADSLVFSRGVPVFYLFQSSFFNSSLESGPLMQRESGRPFLVEFNPDTSLFYPLVSYKNLHLDEDQQITGYFWDGKKWACSAKKIMPNKVEFSYFFWEPTVELTELSPALNSEDMLTFRSSTEEEYRKLNMPLLFSSAPKELKDLLKAVPDEFAFYVSYRNLSGTSPLSFYQQGSGGSPLHARAAKTREYDTAVFADGTVYIKKTGSELAAFRLPLLPAGYTYGDFAIAGSTLYVAWEETNFYKTGRAGFISVDLAKIL